MEEERLTRYGQPYKQEYWTTVGQQNVVYDTKEKTGSRNTETGYTDRETGLERGDQDQNGNTG